MKHFWQIKSILQYYIEEWRHSGDATYAAYDHVVNSICRLIDNNPNFSKKQITACLIANIKLPNVLYTLIADAIYEELELDESE